MGGDGTANEVLNGTGDALPVGVLPAGGTSVLPRALGMPREHRRGRAPASPMRSSQGASAASTWASSTAGASRSPPASAPTRRRCGSSTARAGPRAGGRATPTSRRRSCARCCAATSASRSSRSRWTATVVARGVSVFAANVHPWSYLGPFALKLAPRATFEGGLDVVVPSDMRRRHLPRYATQLLVTGSQAHRTGQAARLPARRRRRARDLQPAAAAACRRRRPRRRRGGRLRRRARRRPDPRVTPLLFDLDGTLVDSRAVVERHWRRAVRAPRARLRGRARGPARRAQRRRHPRRRPGRRRRGGGGAARRGRGGRHARGWRSCGARPRCSPRLPPGSWGIVTSGHRDARGGPPARRRPAGARRHGVRRRGREGQARSRGLPGRRAAARRGARRPASSCEDAPAGIQAARAAGHARDRHHDDASRPPRSRARTS